MQGVEMALAANINADGNWFLNVKKEIENQP